jgi:hypothetical protein
VSAGRTRAVLVVLTLLSTLPGCASHGRATARPPVATRTSTAPSTATGDAHRVRPARRAPSSLVAQAPRTVTLPSGRTVRITAVDTTASGLLDVPDDIGAAGWWRGGSHLGDPFGSILVAAHVDSRTQGLGPFAQLLTVARGARIRLDSADLVQAFEVSSRTLVPRGPLEDASWIFDPSGSARLTLVTCAPPYDASRGGYQNLAVITAVPLSSVDRR